MEIHDEVTGFNTKFNEEFKIIEIKYLVLHYLVDMVSLWKNTKYK